MGSGPMALMIPVFSPRRCAPTDIFTGGPPIDVVSSLISLNSDPILLEYKSMEALPNVIRSKLIFQFFKLFISAVTRGRRLSFSFHDLYIHS